MIVYVPSVKVEGIKCLCYIKLLGTMQRYTKFSSSLKIHFSSCCDCLKTAVRLLLYYRYHPDGVRHRSILPGSCDNLNDVANHWERIKLSYEILHDPIRRKRYDRADVLSNPGMALRRAVGKAALDTVTTLGKGMFDIGASVVQHVVKTTTTVSVHQQQQQQQDSSLDGSISSDLEQRVSKDQIAETV